MSRIRLAVLPPAGHVYAAGRRAGLAYLAELLSDRQARRSTRLAGSASVAPCSDSREER